MLKTCTVIVFLSFACRIFAQDVELPTDFRQHNLGQFNSSIWNPTFALDRNSPRSIALWSRWQWQSIDGDPSTLFLNYTQKINESLAGGIGFLQHNTGIFLQSGVYINAAWETALDAKTTLSFGANIFSFGQELANEQLILLPESEFQGIDTDNSFSTQISPGIRLTSATFSVGFTLQNAISIGLSGPNNASDTTVFQGFISNDFPLQFLGPSAYFRPQAYVNAVSGFDTQVGIVALVGHPNFWAQGGYNSFYGPSLGIGTTLAKTVSVGGLMEFATGDFSNEDPTFELVLSYFIGKQGFDREPLDDFEPIPEPLPTEEEPAIKEAEKTVVTPPTDVNNKKEAVPEEIKPKPLSKRQQARLEKRRRDSIEQVEKAAALIRAEKRRMDSINSARIKEKREKEIKDSIAQVKSREISLAKEQESKEIESKNEKVAEEVKPRTLSKRQQRRLEKRRLDSLAQAEKAAALMRL
ncbi:MAG: PorP/SprF family type IX secretion system membrane protein, partial [Bacteroidota bacterium]